MLYDDFTFLRVIYNLKEILPFNNIEYEDVGIRAEALAHVCHLACL